MNNGYTIAETVVAVAIVVGALLGFFIFAATSSEVGSVTIERQEATAIAREGIEVVRLLRDEDWDGNIDPLFYDTPYYPTITGGVWSLETTDPGPVHGRYNREIRLFEVFRDANDDIAPSGTSDDETRLIRSVVTWDRKGDTKQLVLEAYLTSWRVFIE